MTAQYHLSLVKDHTETSLLPEKAIQLYYLRHEMHDGTMYSVPGDQLPQSRFEPGSSDCLLPLSYLAL